MSSSFILEIQILIVYLRHLKDEYLVKIVCHTSFCTSTDATYCYNFLFLIVKLGADNNEWIKCR